MIRVLCVEDNSHDRDLIRDALERESQDFVMIEASDRPTFDTALARGGFDVVLTDFNILGFSGLKVLQEVRDRFFDIPIIVVTGTGSEEIAVAALKQGADDYVIKSPSHIAQLPHTIQSVLELREARAALRQKEENLQSIMDNISDGILVTNQDGTIIYANPSALAMLGNPPDGLLGEFFGYPITCGKSADIDLPLREGGPGSAEMSTARCDWQGQDCHIIAMRDITRRKKAEAQFYQAQKLESVGRLAGGVAHDFNNMLSIILGYGEGLVQQLRPEDPLQEDIQAIVAAGQRAAVLTRQLLAFSRKQTLQPEVLNLNTVIQNLAKMLQRLIGEDIDLNLSLSDEINRVKADPGQIEQIIMNLAVNARDAMPEGGSLLIETANVKLDETYAQNHPGVTPGSYVMVAVTDTGCGMDSETLLQIFDPFFTTKPKDKGTGLGLATVYGIVKQSGGNIWVYSEPGRGTTFKIYLPESEEIQEAKSDTDTKGTAARGDAHLLVVEDEATLRKMMKRMLSRLGYRVTLAANGGEALLLMEEKGVTPDLVITDVVMPNMSGRDLVKRLQETHPALKVLYMSGYTDDTIVHQGILEPGTFFIQKPFTLRDIGEKIQAVLHGTG